MKNMFNSLINLFKSKKMRYGTNATIVTVVFIAIIIVANMLVGALVQKFTLKADLTKNKMFAFSEQTLDVLKNLNKPVDVYALYSQGQEEPIIREMLDRYAAKSNQIKINIIDPVKNPAFANKYDKEGTGISKGSIIFESGEKFKVIKSYDLVSYNSMTQRNDNLVAEERFTSAIMYVTSDVIPTIYMTEGHGEVDLYGAKNTLEKENYKTEKISLLTSDIPDDAGVIMVVSPQRDFGADEIEKLDAFFDRGGSAYFMFDIKANLPRLESYLNEWGIELQKDVIIEGNPNNFYIYPNWLIPKIQSHEITSRLSSSGLAMIIPTARSIKMIFEEQSGIKVSSLLKSTEQSWGKVNLEDTKPQKQPDDINGPLDIAVVASKTVMDGKKEAKILVAGSSGFLQDDFLSEPNLANTDFLMNSVNWLQGKEENITIRPKSLTAEQLTISQAQALIYSGIVVIVIPLLVFALGAFVYLRRKHL